MSQIDRGDSSGERGVVPRKDRVEGLNPPRRVAVAPNVKVVIHSRQAYESSIANPLGPDRAPHRIWNWSDGSWVLLKFLDDGETLAVTSPGLSATLIDAGERLLVRVSHGPSAAQASPRESVI
ncbi:MAG: hypothetical protein NVSMB47_09320 [Polyangiales bacterium]